MRRRAVPSWGTWPRAVVFDRANAVQSHARQRLYTPSAVRTEPVARVHAVGVKWLAPTRANRAVAAAEALDGVVGPDETVFSLRAPVGGRLMAARRPERRIIERLVERHRGEPFNELLRDPVFRQLSEADVMALAAEYRRQAKRIRAQSDGRPSAGARGFAGDKHGAGA
jgi:hypothetical protein